MVHVRQRLGVSERKACRVLGQARSTQRRIPKCREDEEALRQDVVKVARRFGRYGYRMVTGMLRTEGCSTQRRVKKVRVDESALRTDVIRLASRFGRYGYRQITNLLRIEGWEVNHKRVERIWRQEGLKVPRRQPKRGRLWLNDGSCIRLRPLHKNHVWSYDFVSTRTHDGRALPSLPTYVRHGTRKELE